MSSVALPQDGAKPASRRKARAAMIDFDACQDAYIKARDRLLAQRSPEGHWLGELASSALSTATAVSALSLVIRHAGSDTSHGRSALGDLVRRGVAYLAGCQNEDGGWGDTDKSYSNIATSMLVRAALHLSEHEGEQAEPLAKLDAYIASQGEIEGLRRRYGKDKTFAVPILTNCALAGQVPWDLVSPLPFEAACFPHGFYRFLRLPVVSYAIPALVAIGQARYFHQPPRNPIARLVRRWAVGPSLRKLQRMQPDSGGFLEATPLTSFVVMSLASIDRVEHPVVRRGVDFLVASVREDGSWPIDTNLATWVTTLSINALAAAGEDLGELHCHDCLDWLLSCQHRRVHPFTNADPGGWGWTDLSGAVPDADDTPGALLALSHLRRSATEAQRRRIDAAAAAGMRWLLDLQNGDGGWPTFCRGWGKLPFDRSGVDLTAHVLRASSAWEQVSGIPTDSRRSAAGMKFIERAQRGDGSWVPLWFGNQDDPAEENPVYGTSRVLLAWAELAGPRPDVLRRGVAWLVDRQNADGGWGSTPLDDRRPGIVSGVEETALAVSALAALATGDRNVLAETKGAESALEGGISWLIDAVCAGSDLKSSPIGFYFAKLWYYEELYPLAFTVEALGRARRTR